MYLVCCLMHYSQSIWNCKVKTGVKFQISVGAGRVFVRKNPNTVNASCSLQQRYVRTKQKNNYCIFSIRSASHCEWINREKRTTHSKNVRIHLQNAHYNNCVIFISMRLQCVSFVFYRWGKPRNVVSFWEHWAVLEMDHYWNFLQKLQCECWQLKCFSKHCWICQNVLPEKSCSPNALHWGTVGSQTTDSAPAVFRHMLYPLSSTAIWQTISILLYTNNCCCCITFIFLCELSAATIHYTNKDHFWQLLTVTTQRERSPNMVPA